MGFGMMDLGILPDWDPTAVPKLARTLPSAAYRFFLTDLGFRYDFWSWLGAHLGFDYRAVSGTGEIEDDATWYGAAQTGGINLSLGAHSGWKGFTATAEYPTRATSTPSSSPTRGRAPASGRPAARST